MVTEMVKAVIAAYQDGLLTAPPSSSSSQPDNTFLENYEEDLIFLELQSLARDKSHDLIPYISSIFIGSQHISSSAVSRFGRLFSESIQFLNDGLLTERQTAQLTDLLFANLRNLSKDQAQRCVNQIVAELPRQKSQSSLTVLPQLAAVAGEKCRDYVIDQLCSTTWPSRAVVLFASTLVELNASHKSDLEIIRKISSSIKLHETERIAIEDLPSLIYHLTSIASDSAPPNVRRIVLDTVANSLDRIAEEVQSDSTSSRGATLRQVMSTIVHHLALIVSKDQAITTEITRIVKYRQLFKFCSWRPGSRELSPSRLLLSLLAAKSPRSSSSLILGIVETIHEVCQAETLVHEDSATGHSCNFWFDDRVWASTIEIRPETLLRIFLSLFEGPFMSSDIAGPLLSISVNLMEKKASIKKSTATGLSPWSHLSSSSITMSSAAISPPLGLLCRESEKSVFDSTTSQYFGAWILFKLFVLCSHLRVQITRELVLRLQQHQSLDSSELGFQSLQDQLIVLIFESLTRCCLDGLMEITSELHEAFLILTLLHPHTASDLIRVFSTLFSVSPSLGDRCALALRKASFAKDLSSRHTAVCALTTLLRCQLQSTNSQRHQIPFSSSQPDISAAIVLSQHDNLSQRLSIGVSVDEVLSLCRRFLQHQSSVKSILYNNLALLHVEFSHFRPLISQLFRNHLQHILMDEDHGITPSGCDDDLAFAAGTRGMLILNTDRCIDSSGNILENISDLLLHSLATSRSEASSNSVSETSELLKLSWRLFRGLAFADLSQYSISAHPSSLLEYSRLIVVIEAIHAAMTCVWTFPATIASLQITFKTRMELFLLLCERLESYTTKAVKYRKLTREKEKGSEDSQPLELLSPRLATDSLHRIIRPVVGVDRCSTDCVELEAEFLTKCLDFMHPDSENPNVDEEDYQWRQKLLDSLGVGFLRRHIRERNIRLIEVVLQYSEDIAVSQSLPPLLSSPPSSSSADLSDCLTSLSRVREKFHSLYTGILIDFTMMRTLEIDGDESKPTFHPSLIFTSTSATNHQSCKQLALRGMLGCIRLESFLGKMISRTTTERVASLVEMFEGAKSSNVMSLSVVTGHSRTLGYHAKKFLTLLLRLHESDRGDAPLVVLLLGEISQLMTAEETEILKETIYQECNEKLSSPTTLLSQFLIQLLVLRLPHSPTSRFETVVNLANAIQECCQHTESSLNDDDDDDEEGHNRKKSRKADGQLREKTYLVVCYNTISGSTTTLVHLLEKVCSLLTTLMKLDSKSRGQAQLHSSDYGSLDGTSEPASFHQTEYLMINLCPAVKECMTAAVALQKFHKSFACTVALISLLNKLYKLQMSITKDVFLSISKKVLPSSVILHSSFREMSQHIADHVSPIVQKNLGQIHSQDLHGDATTTRNSRAKLSKLIPDLIFQMESVDVVLIKLHGVVKDKEKSVVSRWIKRTTSRDFRMNRDEIESAKEKAKKKEEVKTNRKRSAEMRKSSEGSVQKKSSAGSNKKKKRKGEDEGEGVMAEMSEESSLLMDESLVTDLAGDDEEEDS